MNQHIEKIKNHVKENKKVYITGISCLIIGSVGSLIFTRDIVKASIDNRQILSYKPINDSTNIIITELIRRGHPGNKILCPQSGGVYPSAEMAAAGEQVSASSVSRIINGHKESVRGKSFENLGEMQ